MAAPGCGSSHVVDAFLPSGYPLHLSWTACTVTVVETYEVCVNSTCTEQRANSASIGYLAAGTHAISVRATSTAGAVGVAAVLNVLVDATLPTLGEVWIGDAPIPSSFWGVKDSVAVFWSPGVDLESGVAHYEMQACITTSN